VLAGEWVDIWVRTSSIGRSSFALDYEIAAASDGRLIARARTVQVMYDYTTGRSRPVPDDLAATLERFEGRGLR
jgi:acyl-CoA thioesterase FadM